MLYVCVCKGARSVKQNKQGSELLGATDPLTHPHPPFHSPKRTQHLPHSTHPHTLLPILPILPILASQRA